LQLGCKFFIYTFALMIKKFKNINLTFLWFAGLMIFAHTVIPHDHHIDFNHETHHNKSNSQDTPIHCFFFNDIIYNNTSLVINKVTAEKTSNSFIDIEKKSPSLLFESFSKRLLSEKNTFKNKIVFLGNIPVRGSPISV